MARPRIPAGEAGVEEDGAVAVRDLVAAEEGLRRIGLVQQAEAVARRLARVAALDVGVPDLDRHPRQRRARGVDDPQRESDRQAGPSLGDVLAQELVQGGAWSVGGRRDERAGVRRAGEGIGVGRLVGHGGGAAGRPCLGGAAARESRHERQRRDAGEEPQHVAAIAALRSIAVEHGRRCDPRQPRITRNP